MTPLFLLWHSPTIKKFWDCLQYASDGSALLLLGEACDIGAGKEKLFTKFKKRAERLQVYALIDNLTTQKLYYPNNFPIEFIDHDDFVALTEAHHPIITWN